MTELLIFTLLATVVALYNILPEHRKVRVNFIIRRRRWQVWVVSLLGIIVAIYAVDQYIQITATPATEVYRLSPVTIKQIKFSSRFPLVLSQILIALVLVASFVSVFFTTRFSSGDEAYLVSKLREYFNREEFGTLVDIISENYDALLYKDATSVPTAASRSRDYLLNSDFAAKHPTIAPELGIQIIGDSEISTSYKKDFTRQFLRTQVRNENSLLYREIANNQAVKNRWSYRLESDNELLTVLLRNISLADDLVVYNAVGGSVAEILREHGTKDRDIYLEPRLSLHQKTQYYAYFDPVFIGIRFMDLLTIRSIEENSDWHLGLNEYMTFTRLICDNYEITPAHDPSQEWSNDYEMFLYNIFQAILDSISVVEYESDNESEYSIGLDTINDEWTGSVAKSAVVCLFICHWNVVTCPAIPDEFKDYISEMIFLTWLSLREHNITELPYWYGKQMEYCLESNLGKSTSKQPYHDNMKRIFQRCKTEIRIKDTQMTGLVSELNSILY